LHYFFPGFTGFFAAEYRLCTKVWTLPGHADDSLLFRSSAELDNILAQRGERGFPLRPPITIIKAVKVTAVAVKDAGRQHPMRRYKSVIEPSRF
jgi:hypothetical protein